MYVYVRVSLFPPVLLLAVTCFCGGTLFLAESCGIRLVAEEGVACLALFRVTILAPPTLPPTGTLFLTVLLVVVLRALLDVRFPSDTLVAVLLGTDCLVVGTCIE